jgi:hypothetical protein
VKFVTDSPRPLRGLPLWRAWLGWVTAGEIAGFAIPALVGSVMATAPATAQLPGFLTAGAAEGAILGYAQARVLRRALPGLSPLRWTVATSLGATLAWAAGMTPGYTWSYLEAAPLPVLVAGSVLLGSVLLFAIGVAQWLVLRHLLPRAGWWVPATAVAWLAGLAGFAAVSTPLWRPDQPWPLTAAVGVLAGAVMAAVMAAVTGVALVRLLAGQSPEPERAGNRRDIRTAV